MVFYNLSWELPGLILVIKKSLKSISLEALVL